MSEAKKKPEKRLERLLRRWGAEEAERQAHPAPFRVTIRGGEAPRRVREQVTRGARRRWPTAVGAAAVLACAVLAAALVKTTGDKWEAGRSAKEAADNLARQHDELGRLAKELGEARRAEAKLDADLAEERKASEKLRGDLAAAQAKAAATAAELRDEVKRLDAALSAMKGRLDGETAKHAAALGEKQVRLDAAEAQLKKLDGEIGALARTAEQERKERGQLRGELLAVKEELEREKAAAGGLRAALREAEERQQREYLAAAAAGKEDVRARQAAARKNNLARRCSELRRSARTADAGRLMETLDLVLTRLELLDAGKAAEVEAFTTLLRRTDAAAQVAKVLAAGSEDAPVRQWLFEVRLVLMGM